MKAFLSYVAPENEDWATRLSDALVRVHIDPVARNLMMRFGGPRIFKELDIETGDCEKVIMVFSDAYVNSAWHETEQLAFIVREQKLGTELICPIRVEKCAVPAVFEGRVIDFCELSFDKAFNELRQRIARPLSAAVIASAGSSDAEARYKHIVKPVCKGVDVVPCLTGEFKGGPFQGILCSEVVVADLSPQDAACFHQAGFARAVKKHVIFLVRKGEESHIDFNGRRLIVWDDEQHLKRDLRKHLKEVLQDIRPKRDRGQPGVEATQCKGAPEGQGLPAGLDLVVGDPP